MTNPTSPPPAALERAREVIAAWCEMTIPVGTKPGQSGLTVLIATALTEERTKALEEALQAYPPLDHRKQYDANWRVGYERLAYMWSTAIRALKAEEGEK